MDGDGDTVAAAAAAAEHSTSIARNELKFTVDLSHAVPACLPAYLPA